MRSEKCLTRGTLLFATPFLLLFGAAELKAQQGRPIELPIEEFEDAELDSIDIADRLLEWGTDRSVERTAARRSIPIYEALLEEHPDVLYLKYRCGIAHLKTDGNFKEAIELLSDAKAERPNNTELKGALAEAYHRGYQFDAALRLLDEMQKEELSPFWKERTKELRNSLSNAKDFNQSPRDVSIRNIGRTINSKASEYVPVISSDESLLIFTYRGPKSKGGRQNWEGEKSPYGVYYEDIYSSRNGPDGEWEEPAPIEELTSEDHEANIALSPGGEKLFLYHYDPSSRGDIYVSEREGDEWTEAEKLKGEVNRADSWEGSVSLAPDGQKLYFSSDREGGHGGKDLYTAELMEDSTWGNVENMGPEVNTERDEDAPFIHPENTALFYSSKGHNSMGGYDIFRSDLKDGEWSEPVNLGAPVNTPSDDIYYVISADGKRGYYSSGKPGGYGRQDIYVVEPGYIHDDPSLVLYKGKVNFCDEPVEADIKVLKEHDEEELAYYSSNSKSGKFLLNLPSGQSYNIEFRLDGKGVEPIEKNVNAIQIDSFVKIEDQIHFYDDGCRPDSLRKSQIPDPKSQSPSSEAQSSEAQTSSPKKSEEEEPEKADTSEGEDSVERERVIRIDKRKVGGSDSVEVDMEYEEIVERYGDMSADGLVFKVQIAAYEHPQNYDHSHLSHLGAVKEKTYPDGITRFTLDKSFETLKEADAFLQKAIDAGQLDAFVIAFVDGERTYVEELVPAVQM